MINIPLHNVEETIWALIWLWQMSLDVASQSKGNGLIEIFVQVLANSR